MHCLIRTYRPAVLTLAKKYSHCVHTHDHWRRVETRHNFMKTYKPFIVFYVCLLASVCSRLFQGMCLALDLCAASDNSCSLLWEGADSVVQGLCHNHIAPAHHQDDIPDWIHRCARHCCQLLSKSIISISLFCNARAPGCMRWSFLSLKIKYLCISLH